MGTQVKNGDKPEIELLNKLKDRLLNLSTREQKINLRPYQGATYDLVSLLEKTSENFTGKFETSLLFSLLAKNREKEVLISVNNIFRSIKNEEDKLKCKERLNYLRRFNNKLYVEKGYKSLYLGFLFLRGYFVNSQRLLRVVNAPLFLFPVDLRKGNTLDIIISKNKKVNYTLLYFLRKELEIENDIFNQVITKLEEISNDDFKNFLFSLKPVMLKLFLNGKIQFNFSVSLNNFLEEPNYPLEKIFAYQKSQTQERKTLLERFFSISIVDKSVYFEKNRLEIVANLVLFIDRGTNLSLFNDFEKIVEKFQTDEERELTVSAFGFIFKNQDLKNEEKDSDLESGNEKLKKTIYTPFLSDPSQTNILEKIFNNFWEKALCVDGPPGTGKTQLISNLLANGLFYDKKILVVCEKNAALQVIANNLISVGLGSYFIKINELSQVPEIFRNIGNTLEEEKKETAIQTWELEAEKVEELEKKQASFFKKINDYCEIEKNFYSQHSIPLSEIYIKNTHQENIPLEVIELTKWVKTGEQLVNLKKNLDNYFEKLGQLFEKNFATCLRLEHLFFNSILGFSFNLETKNKFHNLINELMNELEGKVSTRSFLFPVVSSCLLGEVNEKYYSLLSSVLRKKVKELVDLDKKEELNDFFCFLNLHNFAEFQENCLDASFLSEINGFIDQEFFLLADLRLLFSKFDEETRKNILYFLESSFQQKSPLNYNDYIKITEKAVYFNWLSEVEENEEGKLWDWSVNEVEKIQKNYFKTYWEKSQVSQSLIKSKQREKVSNLSINKDLSAELKKKRGFNLRKIFASLLDHFPIWLTTPETISSLTNLEDPLFDYLIFDEASQMPLEKSVPLFTRARKLVIIGDQQQLPPSDFFKSFWEEEEEEWLMEESQKQAEKEIGESEINLEINDLGKGSNLLDYVKKYSQQVRSCTLTWHYRSLYPQLIEFSNQAFYGGNLEIVGKGQDWETGYSPIEYHKVNGRWEDQQNIFEARAILKLLKNLPTDKEVGIITFNAKQRDLLEDMIEKQKKERSNLFVRNLEEVQGDERDIIIFSIGYGPNEEGRFIHNFGPLNREGGEKRLNVAVTRAREKVIVVTSILPSQLSIDSTKNLGPKFLKLYLEYAWACQERDSNQVKKMLSNEITRLSGLSQVDKKKKFVSPLEKVVYDELVKLGYEVDFQTGSIGRWIDLVVRSSRNRQQYVLGIKCDGWNSHGEEGQIEIDNYRQMLLEKNGWKVIKVISRDWWRNKKREIQRIKRKIESLEAIRI